MKKFSFLMLLSAMSVFSFVACSDYEHEFPVINNHVEPIAPDDITVLEPVSGPRSVIIKWEAPKSNNIAYIGVEFIHPRTGDTVYVKGGVFNDSVEIKGLLEKWNEIEFSVAPVSKTETKGKIQKVSQKAGLMPLVYNKKVIWGDPINISVGSTEIIGADDYIRTNGDVSTNNREPGEGSIANMFDGKEGTYFHSSWSNWDVFKERQCYIQVNLKREVSLLTWDWQNRTTGKGVPSEIEFYGSLDGENFTFMKKIKLAEPNLGGSAWNKVQGICYENDPTQKFSHIRIWVRDVLNANSAEQRYICIAECQLTEAYAEPLIINDGEPYDPNQDGWDVIPEIEVVPAVQ